ncbi:macrolide ABC transporter ATP-binding protein [Candidatus Atribacteria bacterium HGW-Atribacteria-1]|nr:MAG: macrolide ABC transporter ATP-binding protein [Candidatus Atribacteria bacterium HGW-Atribacteria-1]
MGKIIIECHDLHKDYRMGKVTVKALHGLNSLQVRKGEFVAIMGPSGSGKSTLMHIMGALDRPTKGDIIIGGKSVIRTADSQLVHLRAEKIGFVFQTFNLLGSLTALDNVEIVMRFAANKKPKSKRRERAKELLTLVGLGDRLSHKPAELSGGERQRVAIARALANSPEIILADEPTGNVDSVTGEKIVDILRDLNRHGTTVVLITHNFELAEKADRVVRIKDGRVIGKDK